MAVMKTVEVAGAVIVNAGDEILCALRGPGMSMPGYWEFPGGKLEPGEDPRRCLAREIREELGCDVAVGDLIADVAHPYEAVTVRLKTYFARVTAGTPHPHEHAELTWLPVSGLRALGWAPADLPTLEVLEREPQAVSRAFAALGPRT